MSAAKGGIAGRVPSDSPVDGLGVVCNAIADGAKVLDVAVDLVPARGQRHLWYDC